MYGNTSSSPTATHTPRPSPIPHKYPTWDNKPHIIPAGIGDLPKNPPLQRRSPRISIQSLHLIFPDMVHFLAHLEHMTKHIANAVLHPSTGFPMEYEHLIRDPATTKICPHGMCLKLGRLAQGYKHDTDGNNTVHFISKDYISNIHVYLTVTYTLNMVHHRPQKIYPNRVRITVGGNLIHYPGYVATTTADLITK